MGKKLLIILIIGFALPAYSQPVISQNEFSASWSEEFNPGVQSGFKANWSYGVCNIGSNAFTYICGEGRKKISLFMADSLLQKVNKTEHDVSARRPLTEGFNQVGENWFWFYSLLDTKTEISQLFVRGIDLTNGKFTGDSTKIIDEKFNARNYMLFPSPDNKLMLIIYKRAPQSRSDAVNHLQLGFLVINPALEKVWSGEFTMPYTEEMMKIEDYTLGSTGNVFIHAKVYEENEREMQGKMRKYHHELLRLNGTTEAFMKIDLKQENKFINVLHVSENKSGNMVCTGYYSEQENPGTCAGAFLAELDLKQNKVAEGKLKFYEFNEEIRKEFALTKTERGNKNRPVLNKLEESNLQLENVSFLSDGSVVLCGEEFYPYYLNNTSYYSYNDIVVMKINGSGDLAWMRRVLRRLDEFGDSYWGSFHAGVLQGSLYCFYRDLDKNLNLPDGKVPLSYRNGTGGSLVYAKIDSDGNLVKGKVLDKKEMKSDIIAGAFVTLPNGQILQCAGFENKRRFLKLSINGK